MGFWGFGFLFRALGQLCFVEGYWSKLCRGHIRVILRLYRDDYKGLRFRV